MYSHLPLTFPNFHISSHAPRHRCFVGKNILFLAPTAPREFLFVSCFLTFIRPLRYEGERTPPQSTHICSFSLALLDSTTPSRTFPNIHHPPLRVAPLPGPFLSSVAPFSRPIVFSLSSTTSPHRNSQRPFLAVSLSHPVAVARQPSLRDPLCSRRRRRGTDASRGTGALSRHRVPPASTSSKTIELSSCY